MSSHKLISLTFLSSQQFAVVCLCMCLSVAYVWSWCGAQKLWLNGQSVQLVKVNLVSVIEVVE